MAVGLYKPGQGYWVRVLTAAFIGILTLAAAGWTMGQMSLLAQSLPPTDWSLPLRTQTALHVPPVGESVTLLGPADTAGEFPPVGQAKVALYNPDAGTLRITDVKMNSDQTDPSIARAVKAGEGESGLFVELPSQPQSLPAVQPVVLQGVGAAVVILVGTVFAYFFAGVNRKTCEFLIATDLEMKKVNWSTRQHILSSTWVVIGASFIIAAFLYGTDWLFYGFFHAIGLLQ